MIVTLRYAQSLPVGEVLLLSVPAGGRLIDVVDAGPDGSGGVTAARMLFVTECRLAGDYAARVAGLLARGSAADHDGVSSAMAAEANRHAGEGESAHRAGGLVAALAMRMQAETVRERMGTPAMKSATYCPAAG